MVPAESAAQFEAALQGQQGPDAVAQLTAKHLYCSLPVHLLKQLRVKRFLQMPGYAVLTYPVRPPAPRPVLDCPTCHLTLYSCPSIPPRLLVSDATPPLPSSSDHFCIPLCCSTCPIPCSLPPPLSFSMVEMSVDTQPYDMSLQSSMQTQTGPLYISS